MMKPSLKHLLKGLLVALPGAALLSFLAVWQAGDRLAADLLSQLGKRLPDAIVEAGINLPHQHILNDFIVQHIDADLSSLRVQRRLSPVKSCQGRVLQLRGSLYSRPSSTERQILLDWHYGDARESLTLALSCEINWPIAAGLPLAVSIVALLIAMYILPPLPPAQRRIYQSLCDAGLNQRQALTQSQQWHFLNLNQQQAMTLISNVSDASPADTMRQVASYPLIEDDSLKWLQRALEVFDQDLEVALAAANCPELLEFRPATREVIAHGVLIKLPSTPFFYYLWYAQRRLHDDGDGWFVNPPSNRPDHESAAELVTLMKKHGGHQKAINDLTEKGLRAKTLDQNRSKIKDELTQVLSEELAQPFLFETERDHKTARSKYRLIATSQFIRVSA